MMLEAIYHGTQSDDARKRIPLPLAQGFSPSTLVTFGARSFFDVGAILCATGCLAASLDSIQ